MRAKRYPEEKRRILVGYSVEEFVTFLEEITGRKETNRLQRLLPNKIDGFRKGRIPLKLQARPFISSLKKEKEISNPDSVMWDKFKAIFTLWVNSHHDFYEILADFDNKADFDENNNCTAHPNSELDIECFRHLLKASGNNQVDKENIRRFYDYGYFLQSEEIEILIAQAKPRAEIEQYERIAGLLNQVEELQQSVKSLEEELSKISSVAEVSENQDSKQLAEIRNEFEQKLTQLSQRISSAVEPIEARISEITNDLKQMSESLKSQLSETEGKVEDIESLHVKQFAELRNETKQELTQLSQGISAVEEDILGILDGITQSRPEQKIVNEYAFSDAPVISDRAVQIGNSSAELIRDKQRYQSESDYIDDFHDSYLRRLGVVDSSDSIRAKAIHVALKSFRALEISDTRVIKALELACGNCLHITKLDVELGWLGLSDLFPDLFSQECFGERLERKDLVVSIKEMLRTGGMLWAIHLRNYDRSFPETYLPPFLDWLNEFCNFSGITVFLTRCSGTNRCETNEESYERVARLPLPKNPEPIKTFTESEYVVTRADWDSWCQPASDEYYQPQLDFLNRLQTAIKDIDETVPLPILRDIRRYLLLSHQIIEPTKALDWAFSLRLLPWIDGREEIGDAVLSLISDLELRDFSNALRGEL